jgi:AcrR family transcriptional regulator
MAGEMDRSAPPRTPLTRDRVLRAAVGFADEQGVDALTMRRLAKELGFEVMSLYNHVASKRDVLYGMVDLVAAEIDPPPDEAGWRTALRQSAISAHEVLRRHPWATGVWFSRRPGPARLQYMESLLRALREAGFSDENVYHGYHALTNHILGFALQEASFPFDNDKLAEAGPKFVQELSATELPHVVEHITQHLRGSGNGNAFTFVLDLILDGLANLRDDT